jgi:hypothetical protein
MTRLIVFSALFIWGGTAFAQQPTPVDADGDGYTATATQQDRLDCDDSNSAVFPGAPEICDDGIDNDCDGNADAADDQCQGATVPAPADAAAQELRLRTVATCARCTVGSRFDRFATSYDNCTSAGGTYTSECTCTSLPSGLVWDASTRQVYSAGGVQTVRVVQSTSAATRRNTTRIEANASQSASLRRQLSSIGDIATANTDAIQSIRTTLETLEGKTLSNEEAVAALAERTTATETQLTAFRTRLDHLDARVLRLESEGFYISGGPEVGLILQTPFQSAMCGENVCEQDQANGDSVRHRVLRPGFAFSPGLSVDFGYLAPRYRIGLRVAVGFPQEQVQTQSFEEVNSSGLLTYTDLHGAYIFGTAWELGGFLRAGYHATGFTSAETSVSSFLLGGGAEVRYNGWTNTNGLSFTPFANLAFVSSPMGTSNKAGGAQTSPGFATMFTIGGHFGAGPKAVGSD